jgi:hypothetical protein
LQFKGRAVNNLDNELLRMRHKPLWQAFTRLLDPGRLHVLVGGLTASPQTGPVKTLIDEVNEDFCALTDELHSQKAFKSGEAECYSDLKGQLAALPELFAEQSIENPAEKLVVDLWYGKSTQAALGAPLLGWLLLHTLANALGFSNDTDCLEFLRRFGLEFAWQESVTGPDQEKEVFLATLLMQTATLDPHPSQDPDAFKQLCHAPENAKLLGINTYNQQTWFSREGMTALVGVVALQARVLTFIGTHRAGVPDTASAVIADILRQRLARAAAVGYRLDKFLNLG